MANDIVKVKIEGLEELERKLYELPTKFAKKYVRKALRAGAAVWRDEIRLLARKRTGWMASQIAVTTSIRGSELEGTANVGVRQKQDPARLGTEKHTPAAGDVARWTELGTVKEKKHPFIRPAYESKKYAVLDRFTQVLKDGLADIFG